MRKTNLLRLPVLLLCLLLLFTACTESPFEDFGFPFDLPFFGHSAEEDEEIPERRTIPYSEMEYARPDIEAVKATLAELTGRVQNADGIDAVMQADDEATELLEDFYTMETLARLKNYHDTTDAFYEEELRLLEEAAVEVGNLATKYNEAIAYGDFADEYRAEVGDYVYQSMLNSLLLDSDSVQDYKKERAQLRTDYTQMLSSMSVTFEGETYTLEDLGGIDSDALYAQVAMLLYGENAAAFTEVYARMVELDKKTAFELGFDSPADMYYLSFDRDYTHQDALALCGYVKRHIAPLLPSAIGYYFMEEEGSFTEADALSALPGMLEEVGDELGEAWNDLIEYGLYDLGDADGKYDSGFTTQLYAYDAPFIFMKWGGDFRSVTTVAHEFGHFYDNWLHYYDAAPFNLDKAEIYSQALEMLLFEQYGALFPDGAAQDVQNQQLASLVLNGLLYQSALEEFQLRVYELDTFDAVTLGILYNDVLGEYGLGGSMVDEHGADNSWITTTHLFESPFYTISYVTSAFASLEIWAKSTQNWSEGATAYMDLIHADQNQSFTGLLSGAGLRSPLSERTVREVADTLYDAFGDGGYAYERAA